MVHSFKTRFGIRILILICLVSVLPGGMAFAAPGIRYATPTGSGDCSDWAHACTLQAALTGAASGDEIWVMAGRHTPTVGADRSATFQLRNGVAVYGGFRGTETARDQRDPITNVTVLSGDIDNNDSQTPIITDLNTVTGNTTNSYRVVIGATGATLDGFTISAGYVDGSGGGMLNENSSPLLTNVSFRGNSASWAGGGMFNTNNSNPILTHVTFHGNQAASNGGGMLNENSSPVLTDVTFTNNSAADGGGMNNSSSSPTLTNVIFSGNTASWAGGGMENGGGSPILINVVFSNNSADRGGGMVNYNDGNPTLTNVTFSGNSANSGGGIFNQAGRPVLTNVTFSENTAVNEGGGMFNNDSSCNPVLTNVTFSNNSAESGGGMFSRVGSAPVLTNITFSSNSAAWGGGIYNLSGASPAIRNTIFWGNTATSNGAQIYNSGSSPSVSDSVMQDGCTEGTCTNIITTDPLLGALGNYGGSTQTIPLLSGSSAIDTGNDTFCPATDQRGVTRPQGLHCDIGAYEVEQPDTVPPGVTSITRADPNPAFTGRSIRYTVSFSKAVTGVDKTDFKLVKSGTTTAAITGVSGSGTTYTVTISTGVTKVNLRLDLIDNDTIKDVLNQPLGGTGLGNGNFTGQTYNIRVLTNALFRSNGTNDGWVLESGEDTNLGGSLNATASTFYLGDNAQDRQFRAFLHFPTSTLPDNAVILNATLRLRKQSVTGTDPFATHQGVLLDIRSGAFSGSNALQTADFQASASREAVGTVLPPPSGSWYSTMLDTAAFPYVNKTGITQFRLAFQLDDNDDLGADTIQFYSGNYGNLAYRPQLQVQYYVP